MALTQKRSNRWFVGSGLTVIAGLLLILWQRQAVYDQLKLLNYSPDPSIVKLADDSSMTNGARRIYYVNHPELRPKTTFTDVCPTGTEQTVVLGCYRAGQRGIYLLQVTNSQLEGIEQVTAAHEMLHAAYDRLSEKERDRVDKLLTDYYQNNLSNDVIRQTIEDYKETEPKDLVNEMHSIFGTQIADLPPALEEYYSQYFTNRHKVTDYYAAYQQAFTSRQQQIKAYDSQLNSLQQQIDQLQASVKAKYASLIAEGATLDKYRADNQIEAYNSGVSSYNAAVTAYNKEVSRLRGLIDSYNQLVRTRNSIASDERKLVESLSSTTTTR